MFWAIPPRAPAFSFVRTCMAEVAVAEPQSLRDHIAAEEPPPTGAPPSAPVAPAGAKSEPAPPEVTATPEAEADSLTPDAEVSEAARTLRKNRADKRAERIRTENDDLARELQRRRELRSELERFAPAPERPSAEARPAGTTTRPQTPTGTSDPNDPEPQESEYTDYAVYVRDQARWAAREEFRRHETESRARITRETQQRDMAARADTLEAVHVSMRERYADFDAVTDVFVGALTHPRKRNDVAEYLATFKDVAGEISYRIGKSPDLLKAVTDAKSRAELYDALASVKHTITAAKSAVKPITAAPKPPAETVGGAASAAAIDTTKPGTSTKDHYIAEEAEIAERRRRGHRY